MFSRSVCGLAAVVVFAATSSGCYSTATGYQGKLTFAYEASPEDHANFVKPIAPGAKLDVLAFQNGSERELVITKVTSSNLAVLTASSKNERTITLLGGEPGVADVEITARDPNGGLLVDRMFFHVARPQRHLIRHGCTEQKEAIYVAGDTAWVSHELKTADNRPVIGYDYVPLTMEPAGGVKLVEQPQSASGYLYELPKAAARVTLTSNIDRSSMTFRVVSRGDLKEASLIGGDSRSGSRVFEGYRSYVGARVTSGATPVCSQDALTKAKSLTPEICDVSANLEEDGDGKDENREQLALVTAKKFGVCKYEMTLPELAGGNGIVLTGDMQVGRVEFPGDRKSDDHPRWLASLFAGLFVLPNLIGLGLLALARRRNERRAA